MQSLYHILVELLQKGKNIQTGTLVQTKGSAPQVPGALAIFDKGKVLYGTLGGGLLEAEAQKLSASLSEKQLNTLKWIHFNADMNDETGAICGGSSLFFVDTNPDKHINAFSQLVDSINRNKSGVLVTLLVGEIHPEIERFWLEQKGVVKNKIQTIFNLQNVEPDKILSSKKPLWIENINTEPGKKISLFIEPVFPVSQLIIVGAGHIGQSLSNFSGSVDFETVIIDDRPEMTSSDRFPTATKIINKPLKVAFKKLVITPETYIVIASQGHRTDIEALKCCIGSCAAYIGVIGSKRKTALMGKEFVDKKWATPEEWEFVHAPIGIEIHSKSVNEIAVSIIAELIKERFENNFLKKKKRVDAVVLAAGKSTRMGQQKLLMPYKKGTIIKSVIREINDSLVNTTIVVTGSDEQELSKELAEYDINIVFNEKFESGMLSSVQKGSASLNEEVSGMLVLLGDQPMVSAKVIDRLISVFQKTEKGLLVPTFKGKRGHPVLISAKYREAIKSLNPEIGLRELFQKNTFDILEIEMDTENILKDIDTPEDYKAETGNGI